MKGLLVMPALKLLPDWGRNLLGIRYLRVSERGMRVMLSFTKLCKGILKSPMIPRGAPFDVHRVF